MIYSGTLLTILIEVNIAFLRIYAELLLIHCITWWLLLIHLDEDPLLIKPYKFNSIHRELNLRYCYCFHWDLFEYDLLPSLVVMISHGKVELILFLKYLVPKYPILFSINEFAVMSLRHSICPKLVYCPDMLMNSNLVTFLGLKVSSFF